MNRIHVNIVILFCFILVAGLLVSSNAQSAPLLGTSIRMITLGNASPTNNVVGSIDVDAHHRSGAHSISCGGVDPDPINPTMEWQWWDSPHIIPELLDVEFRFDGSGGWTSITSVGGVFWEDSPPYHAGSACEPNVSHRTQENDFLATIPIPFPEDGSAHTLNIRAEDSWTSWDSEWAEWNVNFTMNNAPPPLPDLRAQATGSTPASPLWGGAQNVVLDFNIRELENSGAGTAVVRNQCRMNGVLFDSWNQSYASGESDNSLCGPVFAPVGVHTLEICTDVNDDQVETDEGNNCDTTSITVNAKSDLDVTTLTANPANPTAGQNVTFTWRVANIGPSSTWVGFRTTTRVDGVIHHNHNRGALAGGANFQVTTPAWVSTPGAHTIQVCTDSINAVDESNEVNNCMSIVVNVAAAPNPDLIVDTLSTAPGPAYTTNPMTFSATVRNIGAAAAGAASNTSACIDLNSAVYASCDVNLGSQPTGNLAGSGGFEVVNWVGWAAVFGTHTFRITADSGNVINPEVSEANNTADQTFTVTNALPDLITQNISAPAGLTAGDPVNLQVTVRNTGIAAAAASTTRFCDDVAPFENQNLCRTGTGVTMPVLVPDEATGALDFIAPNDWENVLKPWIASAGQHRIIVCVDVLDAVPESDESNCYVGGQFNVVPAYGAISGYVIHDLNGNGLIDGGEPLIRDSVYAPICANSIVQNGFRVAWDNGAGNSGIAGPGQFCWGAAPIYSTNWVLDPNYNYQLSLTGAGLPAGWQTTGHFVQGVGPFPGIDTTNVFVAPSTQPVVHWLVQPIPPPDLTADNHDARPDGYPSGTAIISGDPITFSVDVINQGPGSTGAPFWVGMCIDTNQPSDGFCDVTPAFPFLGAFPPGFTQNVVWNDVDVGVLPPGTYIYNVYVDPFNNVAESDENNQTDIVGDFTWHSFEVVDTGGFSNRFYLDVDRDGVRDVPWGTGEPAVRDSSLAQCDPSESVIDLVQMSAVHNVTGETSGVYVTNNCNIPNPGDPLVPRILSSTNLRPGDWTFTASIPAPYSLNQANNLTFTVPAGLRVNLGSWGLTPPDFPPVASALTMVSPADFCAKVPAYTYSWNYSDIDGDPQTDYIFQIATDAGFVPGSIVVNRTNPPPNSESVLVTTPNNPDQLNYNTTYWWRVMVRNAANNSGWVNGPSSFLTPPNEYPTPSFTYLPVAPAASESVDFTDTSTCFDAGGTCGSWAWTFQNGTPPNSNSQNPTSFFTQGNNNITMTVWDGLGQTGFSCTIGPNILVISAPIPDFVEVQPIGFIQGVMKWIAWMGF